MKDRIEVAIKTFDTPHSRGRTATALRHGAGWRSHCDEPVAGNGAARGPCLRQISATGKGRRVNLSALKPYPLIYMATPYTKYKSGLECAFADAAKIAARLMLAGVHVYSPIIHTHPMAKYGHVDPTDHKIWLTFDETMMEKADALLVVEMDGWQDSFGIAHEVGVFRALGKPIFHINQDALEMAA